MHNSNSECLDQNAYPSTLHWAFYVRRYVLHIFFRSVCNVYPTPNSVFLYGDMQVQVHYFLRLPQMNGMSLKTNDKNKKKTKKKKKKKKKSKKKH